MAFNDWTWSLPNPQMHGMNFLRKFFEVGWGLPIILCQESLFYWISQKCATDHEHTSICFLLIYFNFFLEAIHFGIVIDMDEKSDSYLNEYEYELSVLLSYLL